MHKCFLSCVRCQSEQGFLFSPSLFLTLPSFHFYSIFFLPLLHRRSPHIFLTSSFLPLHHLVTTPHSLHLSLGCNAGYTYISLWQQRSWMRAPGLLHHPLSFQSLTSCRKLLRERQLWRLKILPILFLLLLDVSHFSQLPLVTRLLNTNEWLR